MSWLIVLLYVVFIMLDYERLMLSFRQLVPQAQRRRVYRIFSDIKDAMNHYFRGQALISFLVGVLFSIGFLIIGLPMGVVLGLFIGVLTPGHHAPLSGVVREFGWKFLADLLGGYGCVCGGAMYPGSFPDAENHG